MCEIVYNILITNFTVHRCIIRSNAPSNLQMQPLGCIFVYALNCITFGTAIDPACGSGSLLLKAAKILGKDKVRQGFFGQEINITTYNLCRINMFLHDIDYDKFNIAHEDTLVEPQHWDDEPFEVIVSIIWSTKLYINILLFIPFLNRKHSYLLKNVKIA